MILWNKRYTLWMQLVWGAFLVALSWMGRQAHGDLFLPGASSGPSVAEFSSIARALSEGNAALARKQIDEMKTKTPDLPHREVILAQMLIQSGMIAEGRLLLEELAAVEPDRYDVRFLFCHLAVIEQRWFEAWHHAIATERLAVPNEWSDAYRSTLRRELAMLKDLRAKVAGIGRELPKHMKWSPKSHPHCNRGLGWVACIFEVAGPMRQCIVSSKRSSWM